VKQITLSIDKQLLSKAQEQGKTESEGTLLSKKNQLQERQPLIQRLAKEIVEANVKIRALEATQQPVRWVDSATEYQETLNQQIHLLTEENRTLRQQMYLLEQRMTEVREDRSETEDEGTLLSQLHQLREENRRLEQYVQDLPELYRKRFEERVEVLETQLIEMQSENSRLGLAILEMSSQVSQGVESPTAYEATPDAFWESQRRAISLLDQRFMLGGQKITERSALHERLR
jgi:chromosome segregation ATPase